MKTKRWKKRILLTMAVLVALIVIFLGTSGPIDPLAYEPPQGPAMEGALAPNELLRSAVKIAEGHVAGPEDVAVDADGRIYAGTLDGRIVRVTLAAADGETPETFADTGGRPLGLHFDANGRLIVADAAKGLLSIAPDGAITTLTTEADGLAFRFTDDLDIASDGVIYFSDASWKHDHHHYLFDLLEARPYGRLVSFDPRSGETRVLLSDLYFANGIALSQDESFVLVNETYRYRITRYWLQGPKAGTSDIFIDNLPGFPDGVSSNRQGTFWLALFTVRNPQMDELHPSAFLKGLMARLPRSTWPKPVPYGLVAALDESGVIRRTLQDPGGQHISQITSVEQHGGYLYIGNLGLDYLSRWALN